MWQTRVSGNILNCYSGGAGWPFGLGSSRGCRDVLAVSGAVGQVDVVGGGRGCGGRGPAQVPGWQRQVRCPSRNVFMRRNTFEWKPHFMFSGNIWMRVYFSWTAGDVCFHDHHRFPWVMLTGGGYTHMRACAGSQYHWCHGRMSGSLQCLTVFLLSWWYLWGTSQQAWSARALVLACLGVNEKAAGGREMGISPEC